MSHIEALGSAEAARANYPTDRLVKELSRIKGAWIPHDGVSYIPRSVWQEHIIHNWAGQEIPLSSEALRIQQIKAILRGRPELEVCRSLLGALDWHRMLVLENFNDRTYAQSPLKTRNRFVISLLDRWNLVDRSDELMTQEEAIGSLLSPDGLHGLTVKDLLEDPTGNGYSRIAPTGLSVTKYNNISRTIGRVGPDLYTYSFCYLDM